MQSLRVQNEKYYRQVAHWQEQAEQLQHTEQQMRLLAQGTTKNKTTTTTTTINDTKKITTIVLEYQQLQTQLQQLLATQVQSAILKALALVHHSADKEQPQTQSPTDVPQQQPPLPPKYRLTSSQIDSLHGRLQAIPGVTTVHKEYLQDVLYYQPLVSGSAVDTDAATATTSGSEASPYRPHYYDTDDTFIRERTSIVPVLLQQVQTDASLQSLATTTSKTRLAFGTTPRGNHTFWTPYRKDHVPEQSLVNGDRQKQQQPPAVVFGMSVQDMVAPIASGTRDSGRRLMGDESQGITNRPVLTSPMGSLHSC